MIIWEASLIPNNIIKNYSWRFERMIHAHEGRQQRNKPISCPFDYPKEDIKMDKKGPPRAKATSQTFNRSVTKVFLKPCLSSITNVLYREKGMEGMDDIQSRAQ